MYMKQTYGRRKTDSSKKRTTTLQFATLLGFVLVFYTGKIVITLLGCDCICR